MSKRCVGNHGHHHHHHHHHRHRSRMYPCNQSVLAVALPSEHSNIYAALMGHHHLEHEVAVQQQMHKAEVAVQQQIYYETRAEELLYSLLNVMLNKVSYHNESAEKVLRDAVATLVSRDQCHRKCTACTICNMNSPSVRPSAPHPLAGVWLLWKPGNPDF